MKAKKVISILICAILCVTSFAACSGKEKEESEETQAAAQATQSTAVDVDLTQLSDTMVYSELANMLNNPTSYIGKTVKMRGQFTLSENSQTGQQYYNVTVMDATACCQQGLEFIWTGHSYPQDYPEVSSTIEVTGVFQTYDEDGLTYCHLISDSVEVVA